MSDDSKEEKQPTGAEGQPPASDPRDAKIKELEEKMKSILDKNSEYEALLVDPGYIDFISRKASGQDPNAGKPAESKKEDVDFDNMTRKELVEYLRLQTQGIVNQVVTPIMQGTAVDKARQQIDAASKKFEDFWDYKVEMIQLTKSNPKLTAEQAYTLAKAQNPKSPKKPAGGEPPGGTPPKGAPKVKGFEDAFEKAWGMTQKGK